MHDCVGFYHTRKLKTNFYYNLIDGKVQTLDWTTGLSPVVQSSVPVTGTLEWTTGLTYFWFSHNFGGVIQILWLKCLILMFEISYFVHVPIQMWLETLNIVTCIVLLLPERQAEYPYLQIIFKIKVAYTTIHEQRLAFSWSV